MDGSMDALRARFVDLLLAPYAVDGAFKAQVLVDLDKHVARVTGSPLFPAFRNYLAYSTADPTLQERMTALADERDELYTLPLIHAFDDFTQVVCEMYLEHDHDKLAEDFPNAVRPSGAITPWSITECIKDTWGLPVDTLDKYVAMHIGRGDTDMCSLAEYVQELQGK